MSMILSAQAEMPAARENENTFWNFDEIQAWLFPLGPRQMAALQDFGDNHARAWLAMQMGIYAGLRVILQERAAASPIQRRILFEDARSNLARLKGLSSAEQERCWQTRDRLVEGMNSQQRRLIGDVYCEIVHPDLRHRLGEHYTPKWLVDLIVDRVPDGLTADPACGDGRFLAALIERGRSPGSLWGADLNPLAVAMARFQVWEACGRPEKPPCQIEWADFILSRGGEVLVDLPRFLERAVERGRRLPRANCYVGNPPWVLWRNLSTPYRSALAAHWVDSSLHHVSGWEARVSAGQSDLSHIFLHEAIERLLPGGSVWFVLPRSVFKGPVGGSQIRSGQTSSHRKYGYMEVWDFNKRDLFAGIRSDTVVAHIAADTEQDFPVPWLWVNHLHRPVRRLDARPSDPTDANSPWISSDELDLPVLSDKYTRHLYRARGGVNTGGANSIFHLRILRGLSSDRVLITNTPTMRSGIGQIEAEVEASLLHPLLKGGDVAAWRASPSGHIVLPHAVTDFRRAMPEVQLSSGWPATYDYLLRFKRELTNRKELARWGGPWYSLFRIGAYTLGCWRVVWAHSSSANLRAAVLAPTDPSVPDQKLVLIPFEERTQAYFVCALLNSSLIRGMIAGSSGLDASPNLTKRLPLPHYLAQDDLHVSIADIGQGCEAGACTQLELDDRVRELYR